jgi:hypothetical protein
MFFSGVAGLVAILAAGYARFSPAIWVQTPGFFGTPAYRPGIATAAAVICLGLGLVTAAAHHIVLNPPYTFRKLAIAHCLVAVLFEPIGLAWINAAADRSPPVAYEEKINGMAKVRGMRGWTAYSVSVRSWTRRGQLQDIAVWPWDYDRLSRGDTIYVVTGGGRFGSPWFRYTFDRPAGVPILTEADLDRRLK